MRIEDLSVEHHRVAVNGTNLHYVAKGSGPIVILLHGFPEMWWSWRHQIEPLAAAGFRVIAPDLRGYDESDRHGPYDIDTLAGDIDALVASLGVERAHVVGHDWGGAVAWHFAGTRPARLEKLAVLNCPHPAMFRRVLMEGRISQLRRSWYMAFFQLPAIPELILTRDHAAQLRRMYRGMARDRANFSDAEIAPLRDAFCKPGVATAALGYYRASIRAGATRDPFTAVKPIERPTLLVWAMDDDALGYDDLVPGTEAFAPQLTVHPIRDCGHFVQAEKPAAVNSALIDFLR